MRPAHPAYIVLGHKRPDLFERLVAALGDAPVGAHIDRKADIAPFEAAVRNRPNVTFLPRHVCHWAGHGHVAGSLEGLKWFLATDASHAVLLTVQCYPLTPQAAVRRRLAELGDRSQFRVRSFPIEEWGPSGGYERIDGRWFVFRGRIRRLALTRRRLPDQLHPHGGGSYWCLSRKHVEYVLDYLARHRRVAAFFKTVLIPDEMIFHTILGNSPLADEVVRERFNYSSFAPHTPHPITLKIDDLAAARASGALFARKFEDHDVLDHLDDLIRADEAAFA
ncbi:hypothetical protein LJR225_002753 [Phenylobacterium sp. LjRoot225]|uniref:beta-1,6-N-acetylglucosaminyltransferase n=1 Tax=Phenylobacterium sp. LjRoot225 TaxID=3342285 RepID=UPI003ECFA4A6